MNDVYLPALSTALDGQPRSAVDGIVSGRLGRWFIRNYVEPSPTTKRVPSPGKIRPDEQIDPAILEIFLRSNRHAKDVVRKAAAFDVNRIRYKNPLAPLVRFSVGTGLDIIWKHQSRHLLQAERVKQSPTFPRQSLAS